jgi:hypothetical protein
MAETKTKPTKISVAAFLKAKATGEQLKDSQQLVKLFKQITGKPAKMWGPSIVGFDCYHYVYESGHEGDAPVIGFSPRKPEMVLYVPRFAGDETVRAKLGKFKASKGCLYVKRLEDIDLVVLKKLAIKGIAELRTRYPSRR